MDIHVVSWSQYDKSSSTAYTAALYCSSLYTPWTFSSDTCRKPYIRACVHYPSASDPSWVLIVAQPWCIWWKHSLCRTQKMKNREEKKNSDQEKKGSSYTSWSGGGDRRQPVDDLMTMSKLYQKQLTFFLWKEITARSDQSSKIDNGMGEDETFWRSTLQCCFN